MEWVRGNKIGHGSFGTVSLAASRTHLMAVKCCGVANSSSLMNEKLILDELRGCPQIISCLGDAYTLENGEKLYNVLLEYASGGSLADKLKSSAELLLPEFEVRRYTKDILRGLLFIHNSGYVHCDIKPQNILLGQNGEAKIADFGLAKRDGFRNENVLGCDLRGTPLYMSPEMVAGGVQGPAADIWALGCLVAEMVTGAPAWRCSDMAGLLMKIGVGDELPQVPGKLSEEGKDFLGKCFIKDPRKRWTAEMLSSHPFVAHLNNTIDDDAPSTSSPRCPFDFPDWASEQSSSLTCSITFTPSPTEIGSNLFCGSWSTSPADRLRELESNNTTPGWAVADDWVTVR